MNFTRINKKDIIVIISLVMISAFLFIIIEFTKPESDAENVLVISNNTQKTYSINENQTIKLENGCIIEIKDKKVSMKESKCKDEICVKMGKIEKSGDKIICLPKNTIIRITGKNEEYDGIAS